MINDSNEMIMKVMIMKMKNDECNDNEILMNNYNWLLIMKWRIDENDSKLINDD